MKNSAEWNKMFKSNYYSQNFSQNTKLDRIPTSLPTKTFLTPPPYINRLLLWAKSQYLLQFQSFYSVENHVICWRSAICLLSELYSHSPQSKDNTINLILLGNESKNSQFTRKKVRRKAASKYVLNKQKIKSSAEINYNQKTRKFKSDGHNS